MADDYAVSCWKQIEVRVEPFPRSPFDFEQVCEALHERLPEHGLSSSCGVLSVTFEPGGLPDDRAKQVAQALASAGIEAADVVARTVWTVMGTAPSSETAA